MKYLIQFVVGIPIAFLMIAGLQKEFKLPIYYAVPVGTVLLSMYGIASSLDD